MILRLACVSVSPIEWFILQLVDWLAGNLQTSLYQNLHNRDDSNLLI